MAIDATRSGVASQLAQYFSSNYDALLVSSAAQQPVTPLAPQAWKDAVNATGASNANTRFFLKQDGSLVKQSTTATSAQGWSPPLNSVEVDMNVAYGIESAGLSPTDWLMKRIADEFRLNNATLDAGSFLTQTPEPDMNVDFSSLDTASLVRLLNMLAGRARDGQRETAVGNARDITANAQRLGLSVRNLANALELQATYLGNGAVNEGVESLLSGQSNAARDALVNNAIDRIVAGKTSEYEGARLAFGSTPASKIDSRQLNNIMRIASGGLDSALQSAADIALMDNPYLGQFGSELDFTQTNDGLLIQSMSGASRQQQTEAVKAQLQAALQDPAFRQNMVDAMAANAAALGTASMPLDEQLALYGQVADGLIAAALDDDVYLEQLASHSVQFRSEISELISNEVEASRERESVYKNA